MQAMVFTDTCLGAQRLSIFLRPGSPTQLSSVLQCGARHMGMKSICLHGQMNQAPLSCGFLDATSQI